ncbi:MAG: glycosyltransferase family protein [Coraliomargarita sp.]
MRILQIGYAQQRRFGDLHAGTEFKLYNGLIRLNHQVIHYSDRDMAAFLAPFKMRDLGKTASNKKLIETATNYQPDMMLLGHCDIIKNETLDEIRRRVPKVRIAHRYLDPLFVPRNIETILYRSHACDSIFITTAGEELEQFRGNRASIHFMPNPCCASYDCNNNSAKDDLPIDLFFCGNSEELSNRTETVNYLRKALAKDPVQFNTYGYGDTPNAWGYQYDQLLGQAKMGLNLNRQEQGYLYSSDRIAQLMGNGILAFVNRATQLNELIGEHHAAFFDTNDELLEKIRFFAANDSERKRVAEKGRRFYHKHFSAEKVAEYIISHTFGNGESPLADKLEGLAQT